MSSATRSSTIPGNDDSWQEIVADKTADAPKDSDKAKAAPAPHDSDYPMHPVDSEPSVKRATSARALPGTVKIAQPTCPCASCTSIQAGLPYPYIPPIVSVPDKPTATLFCQEGSGKSAIAKIFLPQTYEETKAAALRAFPDILKPSPNAQPTELEFEIKVRIKTHPPQSAGPSYGYRAFGFLWASVHADDWWEMLSEMMRKEPLDPVELQVEVKGRCEDVCGASVRTQGSWAPYPPPVSPYLGI